MNVDERRGLRVPELADVEVALDAVRGVDLDPAEHDVARRLREALALDHPLAAVRELAVTEERLQDRRLGLLELEEQRIVVVAAEHEADPGSRADAADADHLAGRVHVAEAFEQLAPVARERAAVGAHDAAEELLDLVHVLGVDFLDRHDQRRVADDPELPVDLLGQLPERLDAVLGATLGDVRLRPLGILLVEISG